MMYNWSQSDGYSRMGMSLNTMSPLFLPAVFNYSYSNVLKSYQILANLDSTYAY